LFGFKKNHQRIQVSGRASAERISILLPVLNEAGRIERCIESLLAQPEEVYEILIVDGGSTDATPAIVERFRAKNQRLRWIDASPADIRWTGKAWGLNFGLQRTDPSCQWILCVDADVWVSPELARSLLEHAKKTGVTTFSIATRQYLSGKIEALIHPAMLTTLVYRFGSPGTATRNRHKVQANGQCFFSRRRTLLDTGAFRAAQSSLCEDITIARRLAECGQTVGFYEAGDLAGVTMYEHWRETWQNWPRSLPMRDQYFGWREAVGLFGVLVVQALPLPAFVLAIALGAPLWFVLSSGFLFAIRLGVLLGLRRAYPNRPWTYWLSPLFDLPVALRIIQFALRRRHSWRGRTYVRRKGGVFEPLA
jgi:dolichol-phosphate mannosyltransferase